RITSNEPNFPVPTMRRDENGRPAITRGSVDAAAPGGSWRSVRMWVHSLRRRYPDQVPRVAGAASAARAGLSARLSRAPRSFRHRLYEGLPRGRGAVHSGHDTV